MHIARSLASLPPSASLSPNQPIQVTHSYSRRQTGIGLAADLKRATLASIESTLEDANARFGTSAGRSKRHVPSREHSETTSSVRPFADAVVMQSVSNDRPCMTRFIGHTVIRICKETFRDVAILKK